MDLNNLLNKFLGQISNNTTTPTFGSDPVRKSNLGMASGAIAGSALALLMGNKNIRKLTSAAVGVGGMALLGGMAGKAFQSWQEQKQQHIGNQASQAEFTNQYSAQDQLEMTILKAMIAAAKSDGHIDAEEQQKIFRQSADYSLTADEKSLIFDLIARPIELDEVCASVTSIEHKAEIYLASKLVCAGDTQSEKIYLASLAEKLSLPQDLVFQLDKQVSEVTT